jgi:hypothetical protein
VAFIGAPIEAIKTSHVIIQSNDSGILFGGQQAEYSGAAAYI